MSDNGESGLSIRACKVEDVEAILELWRQADATRSVTDTKGDLQRAVDVGAANVLVAVFDGRIVGSIIGTFDGWRGNIYRLAVHPDYRRRGIARGMVAEVERRLAKQGAKRITALVEKDHPWPTNFWEAVGFARDHRIARYVRNLEQSAAPAVDLTAYAPVKLTVNDSIYLSEIRSSDKGAYVEYLNDKDIYDRTLRIPFPYTEIHAEEWLAQAAKSTKQHGQPANWAIRNDRDCLIGGIGFDGLTIGKLHRAEIGYWLAKPYWGRGIMTAVVQRVCRHAFDAFGLAKITAHVFLHNPASARVLQKCGFREEGILRKHYIKDGRLIDARLFALLR